MMEQDLSSEANLHDLHLFCSYLLYIIYKKRTPMTTADEFLTVAFYFYMKAFIVKLNKNNSELQNYQLKGCVE